MCSFMKQHDSESTNEVKEGVQKMSHNLNPAGDGRTNKWDRDIRFHLSLNAIMNWSCAQLF